MFEKLYLLSWRSKRPPRFLQTKGLHQIKIWKFSPSADILPDGKMFQFSMDIQVDIQWFFTN